MATWSATLPTITCPNCAADSSKISFEVNVDLMFRSPRVLPGETPPVIPVKVNLPANCSACRNFWFVSGTFDKG